MSPIPNREDHDGPGPLEVCHVKIKDAVFFVLCRTRLECSLMLLCDYEKSGEILDVASVGSGRICTTGLRKKDI
jgi:hypothetical protein